MAERGSTGGKILNLTKKRALRVQEKMMQKLGKSDQTKDDVFEDFVTNFNRQSMTAHKLQKELTRFMNALRVLNQCTRSLGDTLAELYEPGWAGCDKYGDLLKTRMLLWEDQLTSLQSKMIEPMNNYISKFPEVKNRIHKRERKVVDYDRHRRELEALKTKQKVTDQKLQQAEEHYSQSKQLYDEITDELYEELPTFFDSRIQFYASIFQSLAATEARFHAEMTKVDEDFAAVMDGLASEAATAIHTTKKERTLDSTPKLLSRPPGDDDSDSDTELPASPCHPSSTPPEDHSYHEEESPSSVTPTHDSEESKPERPVADVSREDSLKRPPPSKPDRSNSVGSSDQPTPDDYEPVTVQNSTPEQAGEGTTSPVESASPDQQTPTSTPSKPPPIRELSDADMAELDDVIAKTEVKPTTPTSLASPARIPPPKPESPRVETTPPLKDSDILFKVQATHPYVGEDEDELCFEKGDIISVVPYEDPEDEEEGWLTGVLGDNKGIFPENFTKKMDQ